MLDADATIAALTETPGRTAVLADFDGSLAPIVERPEDARPLPEATAVLDRLASRLGRVGIVSGRPVGFLAAHLPDPRLVLVGLYGMERRVDGERRVDPRVEPYLGAVAEAGDELEPRLPAGVVERKAGISVTLHWRPTPDRAAEIVAAGEDTARRLGLDVYRSRKAIELRPPIAVDKGAVVRELVDGYAVAAFAGDDTGDLPAFAALAQSCADGAIGRAVRIGVHSPEAPPELDGAVDVVVDGPAGLVALLARVADEIG
ncbi:MAG TPA: trehalose-phosphatase [Acidimicrobiia bacterium]|nr:trehalose-phosphatase [Acidimicrobiia bacterium]